MLPLLSLFRKNDFNLKKPPNAKERKSSKHLKSFFITVICELSYFPNKIRTARRHTDFLHTQKPSRLQNRKPVSDLK